MNNCKGYLLLDAMIGISIFTFVVIAIVPQLTNIYEERLAIKEKHFAIAVCHDSIQKWIAIGEEPRTTEIIGKRGTMFTTEWRLDDKRMEICVNWMGAHGRKESICGQAK